MPDGRFAPSPSGELHLGNLRTALLAWLFARSSRGRFLMRVEDLDPATSRQQHEEAQLRDLAALGIDWDGEIVRQSERIGLYEDAIATLASEGLVYPCYCTRREIHEAASAPHGDAPEGAYPGRCRDLTDGDRYRREAEGRRPALRLRAQVDRLAFVDRIHGRVEGVVDDVVLRRNDGTPAYNLAVVVDDALQGVGEVVRGDDLLLSTPRQIHLAALLGLPAPAHAHVPLVLGPDGKRLAKRDGAVTLDARRALGQSPAEVLGWLASSVGLAAPGEPVAAGDLVDRFDPGALPRAPWVLTHDDLAPAAS